jgi:type IV pilus assembly protein PilC
MPEFITKYANARGQVLEQLEHADSEEELRTRYAQSGLYVFSVRAKAGLALRRIRAGRLPRGSFKLEPFLIFNQQFVTLIRAGLPILKALDLLTGRVSHAGLRGRISDVRERVRGGALLSEAFAAQGIFPKIYTTTLLAGEKSGNLEEVLDRFITYTKLALSVRKKILVSLVYPALLVVLTTCLIVFLTTYVVPNFAALYKGMEATLPPMTQALIAIGVGLRRYFIVIGPGIVVLAAGIWLYSRSRTGRKQLDHLTLHLPLAGEIWLKYQVASFSRMLATLLAGGIPLVTSLETASESFASALVRRALASAGRAVREGRPLSSGLRETGFVPGLAVEMVEVGESTGALPQMLNSVAEFYEEDVGTRLQAALALVEPAILVFMGVVVAFVLVSLYLPIFSLAERMR